MHKLLKFLGSEKLLFASVFLLISFIFVYKLDYYYFFTDEILYVNSGQEYLKGIYESNLQHPFIGKYIAGLIALISSKNVFILRLPFALMGVISVFLVYLIIKDEIGKKWGLLGALYFSFSPFIFDATRMVMFEAPMHLFWLLFSFFFLKYFKNPIKKYLIISGVFMGLAVGTKYASVILFPVSLIVFLYFQFFYKNIRTTKEIFIKSKDLILMYFLGFGVFSMTFSHFLLNAKVDDILNLAKTTYKVFFGRNTEGKPHLVAGQVFTKSPWWYYFYNIFDTYFLPHWIAIATAPLIIFFKRNIFVLYWVVFLIFDFLFFQLIPLKNTRYISSLAVPLVFLSIYMVWYLWHKKLWLKVSIVLMLGFSFIYYGIRVYNIQPTEYHGLYLFFKDRTNSFQNYERMYVFGSIRSMKWYRDMVPNEHMFLYREDYEIMCPEFPLFKYIVFDREEILKYPDNMLREFVEANRNSFLESDIAGMQVFTRKDNSEVSFDCPQVIID